MVLKDGACPRGNITSTNLEQVIIWYSRNIQTPQKTILAYLKMDVYFGAFTQMGKATLNFVMKISRAECVKNGGIHGIKEDRDNLHTMQRRRTNWIGHNLLRNCFLKHVIEGKMKSVEYRRGWGGSTPHPKFRRPSKIVSNSTRL